MPKIMAFLQKIDVKIYIFLENVSCITRNGDIKLKNSV